MKNFSVFIFCLLLASCSSPLSEDGALHDLDVRAADDNARISARAGDYRMLGVRGFSLEVPGVPREMQQELLEDVRVIPNTGDVVGGNISKERNLKARAYAEAYNQEMLLLKPQQLKSQTIR